MRKAKYLTFREFNLANIQRCYESMPACTEWSLADWGVALAGEVGEACNIIKKLKRLEADFPSNSGVDRENLYAELSKELADVFTYLDLLCDSAGYNLEDVVTQKFNEVSDRFGSDIKL